MEEIVKKSLENAKLQIQNERDRQVAAIKNQILQETMVFNQEIDKIKSDSIIRITNKYNEDRALLVEDQKTQLNLLEEKFNLAKKTICDAADAKKKEHFDKIFNERTLPIMKECDKAISRIDHQFKELKK